jgi:hypothetical protein
VPTSAILSPNICDTALRILQPTLAECILNGPFNRGDGFLIVLDPTRPYEPEYHDGPVNETFIDDVILWTHRFGVVEEWQHPFHRVALAKAYATYKYQLPAHTIVQEVPYLLEPEFTKYGGSAIDPVGGLVVAFSGVQAYFDRMICEMFLAVIRALSIEAMLPHLGDPEVSFLPNPIEGQFADLPDAGFNLADNAYQGTHP